MRMNGLPMTLKAFQSRLTPDALFNHYESQAHRWGRSEYRRSVDGEAQIARHQNTTALHHSAGSRHDGWQRRHDHGQPGT